MISEGITSMLWFLIPSNFSVLFIKYFRDDFITIFCKDRLGFTLSIQTWDKVWNLANIFGTYMTIFMKHVSTMTYNASDTIFLVTALLPVSPEWGASYIFADFKKLGIPN